MITVSPLFTF